MIELVKPNMLLGLALIALPVLAHLLHRHAPRRLKFPAVRWLIETTANQRSWIKLRRPLLLLLRCAVVALIACAFARPEWQAPSQAADAAADGGGTSTVLVLDASLSTTQVGAGAPAFEVLKSTALRALERLKSADEPVQLVIARRVPQAVFDDFTSNHAAVAHEIRAQVASSERAELTAALTLAGKQLAKRKGPRKVVIVSDMQSSSFVGIASIAEAQRMLPQGTALQIEPFELAPVSNLALSRPSIHPPRPQLGQAARLGVVVQNYSDRAQSLVVQLSIDAAESGSRALELAPHGQAQVAFQATFNTLEQHAVQFSIPSDGLAADNAAYAIARPIDALPVLIVGRGDENAPGSAAYYVSRALAPESGSSAAFSLSQIRQNALTAAALERNSVVVIADADALSADSVALLEQYLRRGGSLLYFSGHAAAKANLSALAAKFEAGALPFELGSLRSNAEKSALRMVQADARSPVFGEFSPLDLAALADFRLTRTWSTTALAPTAHKLIEYDDHSIAAAHASVGRGRLLLCNWSPAFDASDVGNFGAFVALMQSMISTLPAHGQSFDAYTLGDSIVRVVPELGSAASRVPSLLGPDATRLAQANFAVRDRSIELRLERALAPGIYRVLDGTKPVDAFALNVDERESDLSRLLLTAAAGPHAAAQLPAASEALEDSETAQPLWGWLVLAALLLLALESMLVVSLQRGSST